jgi:hypothetical protein
MGVFFGWMGEPKNFHGNLFGENFALFCNFFYRKLESSFIKP